jgi:glycosyltransferase involved in cell wall biosynthesis
MELVTVLTPAYNRAHTLARLYESLLAQTHRGFELLVIDDGSNDGTADLVADWIRAGEIDVRTYRQPNRGKHVAVNRGVELARGTFTTIVDSDDWFVPNALERLLLHWYTIPEDDRASFSGVVGLCAFANGRVVGDRYPIDPLDCDPIELTYVHGVTGDKQSLLRTDVLREFPFPFEELSGWVPEGIVINRMALEYRERHVNEIVVVKEYKPDGISDRALELLVRAAPATRQFNLELARCPRPISARARLRAHANFARFSYHAGFGPWAQFRTAPSRVAWLFLSPVALGLYLRDRRQLRTTASMQPPPPA